MKRKRVKWNGKSSCWKRERNGKWGVAESLKEEREKIAAERTALDAEFKRLFGKAVNPLTNKPIESAVDYLKAWEEQQRRDDEEERKAAGISNERFSQMVQNLPEYKQAMAQLELLKKEKDQLQKAHEEEYFNDALKEIQKMDPSIKSREELEKHASYPEVYDLVMKHGLTLEKAFKYANIDALSAKESAAAKQAAINQAKGKNHMEATGTGVAVDDNLADVPASTMAEYKKFYPNLTEAQIKVKYNELFKK